MQDEAEVVEVTANIELQIVGDRLHATVTSGNRKRTYSLSFNRARNAAKGAIVLLNEQVAKPTNVARLGDRKRPPRHG